jgi:hypothetical protein
MRRKNMLYCLVTSLLVLVAGCTVPTATVQPTATQSASVSASTALDQIGSVPDDNLTPGAIVPGCTYPVTAARAVPDSLKAKVRARYHYFGPTNVNVVEIDHRVPHSLCGADTLANLWVQLYDGVKTTAFVHNRKDQLEDYAADQVRSGKWTLAEAQNIFLKDWRVAWQCVYTLHRSDCR